MTRQWSVTRLDELFEGLPTHLSVDELAGVLGVHRNTAYRRLSDEEIPAYRVRGGWLILRDEIRDYLESNKVGPRQCDPATGEKDPPVSEG
jgi:excisionase family DNA binding protein